MGGASLASDDWAAAGWASKAQQGLWLSSARSSAELSKVARVWAYAEPHHEVSAATAAVDRLVDVVAVAPAAHHERAPDTEQRRVGAARANDEAGLRPAQPL